MDHNPLILKASEGDALTLPSRYPAMPRSAPAPIAGKVLVGLVKGLHHLLFVVILWLRLPLLWACDVIARLTIVGVIVSALFWSLSTKPEPIVVQTAFVCLGVHFACHLLLWVYESLLDWLSPYRL
ncbi:MAG: hypothetical protein WBG92_04165 [Thiohalocapsa sp.]